MSLLLMALRTMCSSAFTKPSHSRSRRWTTSPSALTLYRTLQDAAGVAKDGAPINFAAALQARVWQKNQLRKRRQRLRHNVRLDLCRGGHILQHGRDQFHYFVVAAILQQRHQRRQVAHYKFRAKAEVAQRAQSVALTIEIWALQQLQPGEASRPGCACGT